MEFCIIVVEMTDFCFKTYMTMNDTNLSFSCCKKLLYDVSITLLIFIFLPLACYR